VEQERLAEPKFLTPHRTIAERVSRDTTFFHAYLCDKKVLRKGRCYFTATNDIINLEYTVSRNIIFKREVLDVCKPKT
jgi:hypothetical protein